MSVAAIAHGSVLSFEGRYPTPTPALLVVRTDERRASILRALSLLPQGPLTIPMRVSTQQTPAQTAPAVRSTWYRERESNPHGFYPTGF